MRHLIIFFTFVFSTSASGQSNLFTAISESEDHTIFTELLVQSGLDKLLMDDSYYSVFAPTDEAFMTVFTAAELDSIKMYEPDYLEKTLKHHILTDTAEVEFGNEYYPLFGNQVVFFIDGAGNAIVYDGNSGLPNPTLGFPMYEDFDNGRVLWLTKNMLQISAACITDLTALEYPVYKTIESIGLRDSIESSAIALTIVVPDGNVLSAFIDSIGGYDNIPVLDSFMRRHILKGHFAPQDIYDGLIAESWYGDEVLFSVKNDTFYVNEVMIRWARVEKNGALLFTTELLPTIEIETDRDNKTWFADDEEWVYRYFSPFATEGYGVMQVVSDTLIDNQNAKLLQIDRVARDQATSLDNSSIEDLVAYEKDGRVYVLNSVDEFVLNYDMNLVIGDSLVYWGESLLGNGELCQDSVVYFLDSLSTMEVGADTLRVQHFTVKDYYWDQETQSTVVEKIGSLDFGMDLLSHIKCYFDGDSYWLCSYENEEEYIKFLDEDCFAVPSSTKNTQLNSSGIYPNPTSGIIYFEEPELVQSVSVYSIDGRQISKHDGAAKLDLTELPSNIYLISRVYRNGDRDKVLVQKR